MAPRAAGGAWCLVQSQPMRFLVDTDILIEILRGNAQLLRIFTALPVATILYVSSITAAELYHGAARSRNPAGSRAEVAALLSQVQVLPVDDVVAARFGELKAGLQAAGQVIADFDLLIAATALVHDLPLATHNIRDFTRIRGLRLDDWMA